MENIGSGNKTTIRDLAIVKLFKVKAIRIWNMQRRSDWYSNLQKMKY